MRTEVPEQYKQYGSLSAFDVNTFPPRSFLSWKQEHLSHRKAFFAGVQSVEEALLRLLKEFPDLQVVRGSSFTNPLGEKGDFFVGDLVAAITYTQYTHLHDKREWPIIVTTSLKDILQLLEAKEITIFHSGGDLPRFTTSGVINISLNGIPMNELPSYFQVNRPPRIKIDTSRLANFVPSLSTRILRLISGV